MKFEQYKSYTGKGIRTVIVDSGLNCDHEIAKGKKLIGYSIKNEIVHDNGYNDKMGHGTAVYSLIHKIVPDTDFIIFKLFDTDFCCSQINLEIVLEYIYNNIPCDIINISAGTCILESNRLYEICKKLNDNGIIILAAFDNVGAISFPAAFDCVIGVDSSTECKTIDEFEYIDHSLINIRAKGGMHRVAWIHPEYAFVEGTSFSVAYATAAAIKLVQSGCRNIKDILSEFKNNAIAIYNNYISEEDVNISKSTFKIKKAVVFPYSKEIDSLIRFYDQLNFEILHVCDYRLSGKIGMNISKQRQLQNQCYKDFIIRDIKKLNWQENFDTVILGYTDRIENLTKFDHKEYILRMCIEHKKNIYMFDNNPKYNALIKQMKECGLQVFYPCVTNADIPQNRFGKMYRNAKPVAGIFGTSSHQGKFTLQLELIKSFSSNYKLASIGTEPTAPLFGMDFCFPMGYHSTVYINSYDSVFVLNDAIHRISDDVDLILVCSQYTTLPFDVANISMFTNNQYDFLMGTQPEAIVMTINPFDDFDYVKRTVKFLESAVDAKVVAIVVYPITIADDWTGFCGRLDRILWKKAIAEF